MKKILMIFFLLTIVICVNAAMPQDSVYYSLYNFLQTDSLTNAAMQEQRKVQDNLSEFGFAKDFIWVNGILPPYKEGINMNEPLGVYTFSYKGSSDPSHVLIKYKGEYYIYNSCDFERIISRLLEIKEHYPHDLSDSMFVVYTNALQKEISYLPFYIIDRIGTNVVYIHKLHDKKK